MAAFPSLLSEDVRAVLAVVPDGGYAEEASSSFTVEVRGEVLAVPSRIYREPVVDVESSLTATQRLILHCVYPRHCDGRIRQRHLERMLGSREPWPAPFVLRLVGEYVLPILRVIQDDLPGLATPGSAHRRLYGELIAGDPAFFALTERRVVSHWSAHHRRRHPDFAAYPGGFLLDHLRDAAAEHTGTPWPRHTPSGPVGPSGPAGPRRVTPR